MIVSDPPLPRNYSGRWQTWWYDSTNKQRWKSFGLVKKTGRMDAVRAYERWLANEYYASLAVSDPSMVVTVTQLVAKYQAHADAYYRDADGDNAVIKLNEGIDLNGSGAVDYVTPGSVVYGFEEFGGVGSVHDPGYFNADGSGYSLSLGPVLAGFPSGYDESDARRLHEELERRIRLHPEQYLWLHRRFKTQRDRPSAQLYGE